MLLELEMLRETGKLAHGADEILAYLARRIGLTVCQLPMAIVAPLITSDRRIREHYSNAIW